MPASTSPWSAWSTILPGVVSEPLRVVNPDDRHLDGQVRSATGKLTRRLVRFAAMTLDEPIEPKMANSLREHRERPDEARCLLRALYTTEADLLPDSEAGTRTVRLHHAANVATDRVIEKPCEELNATETIFSPTNLRLVLKSGSTEIPRNQVV